MSNTGRRIVHGFAGADWIEATYKVTCSPLGRLAADILGYAFAGIYHLNARSLGKANWACERYVTVTLDRELATFDGMELTMLAVLAHDAAVRVSVEGASPRHLRLHFHLRERDGEPQWGRHPTIEGAIKRIRSGYRVAFASPAEPPSPEPRAGIDMEPA